jgi:hypothetical protein
MKEHKIRQRLDKAIAAFFENPERQPEHGPMTTIHDSSLAKLEVSARVDQIGDLIVKSLKRAFLFLPGAIYLFFGTISILTFEFLQSPLKIAAIFTIGAFMTIFGLGTLRNPKHLAIPVSIVFTAAATFALFSSFGGIRFVFEYGIFLFPLALVLSFLSKNLVDTFGGVKAKQRC